MTTGRPNPWAWLRNCRNLAWGLLLLSTACVAASPPPGGLCGGAWLGLSVASAPDGAVRISRIEASGPAVDAGLRPGDVIHRIADVMVRDGSDLAAWVGRAQPGEDVALAVRRDGNVVNIDLRPWGVPKAVCLARYGEHYLALQDRATAESYFRAAIEIDPQLHTARQRLDELARTTPPVEYARQAVPATTASPGVPHRDAPDARVPNAGTLPPDDDAPAGGRADGKRAMVAVGGFEIKAAKAAGAIGDGLREMLVTALHQNGYFRVVERDDLRGLRAEQDLSRSPLARGGSAMPQRMDVADIMVFGAVTEFEPAAGGSSFMSPVMGLPLAMGARITWSEMALDVRVVDVRTGRVLGAERIPGMARFAQATIAGAVPMGPVSIPASLSVYRNTPMEFAIRDCLRKVGYFVINSIDDEYFRHQ